MNEAGKHPTPEELKDEDRRIRHLRRMADFTITLILSTPGMTPEEASGHAAAVRELALKLFPGKEEVYDLVYGSRFRRLIVNRFNFS